MNLPNSLSLIHDLDIRENVNLEKFTTMRLSITGTIIIVKSERALSTLVKELNRNDLDFHLIGWGANQIIHNTKNTVFIKLEFNFERTYLDKVREEYDLPASVPLNILTSHASKFGLMGWEVFTGIPASLGGAIFMNAGTNLGEIGDLVNSVRILSSNGDIREEKIRKNSFKYRSNNFVNKNEVILSAKLRHLGLDDSIKEKIKTYLEMRKSTQPLATKNCGCVFKNYDTEHRAGQYIDACGLKGLTVSGLSVSHKHANFIENKNEANSEDFVELSNLLIKQLEVFSGLKFELEAKVY